MGIQHDVTEDYRRQEKIRQLLLRYHTIFNSSLLDNIKKERVFSKDGDVIWQCSNCGHIVIGKKAPEECPVCNHPQAYFQVKAENY
jgi:rubrerythrin